ncbi:DUF1707 SHOCT-like domain-containing protein [Streptomyces halobius]|uniref:DUF1707 domain-containing protein n=1 Tax=Streptomyces halobius TaxID=2879846 RepID=A0ABY4MGZ8_9ACTN|nr:DUF1707 domain-containing protein [Streptomyces halobius]
MRNEEVTISSASPLPSDTPDPSHTSLRVGHAEREAAVERLTRAYADGRLDQTGPARLRRRRRPARIRPDSGACVRRKRAGRLPSPVPRHRA